MAELRNQVSVHSIVARLVNGILDGTYVSIDDAQLAIQKVTTGQEKTSHHATLKLDDLGITATQSDR
jgi:hypothetical protein